MFKQCIKHSYQWLHSTIHHKNKTGQSSPDSLRIQGPSKDPALPSCIQSLLSQKSNRKGGKCKRWRPVIDLSKVNTFLLVERFKMETPRVHQGISGSRGMGVIDRPIRCLSSHPHLPQLKKIPKVLPQFTGLPVHLPPFQPSHSHTGLYNDCK